MRKFLASTFFLTLFAVAFAGPPIDYELTCGEGGDLIGVLSLTGSTVHVALVADFVCDDADVLVVGPEGAPTITVKIDWSIEPPVTVTIGDEEVAADDVDLVVVPQVAVDGMKNAHGLRAAAMERRSEAKARREAAREGHAEDGEHGETGDREPAGPPAVVPPVKGPPIEIPTIEGPPIEGPPIGVPPIEVPPIEGPPIEAPGEGQGRGRRP